VVLPLKYSFAGPFKDNLAAVGISGLYGLIDNTGKVVVPINMAMWDRLVMV